MAASIGEFKVRGSFVSACPPVEAILPSIGDVLSEPLTAELSGSSEVIITLRSLASFEMLLCFKFLIVLDSFMELMPIYSGVFGSSFSPQGKMGSLIFLAAMGLIHASEIRREQEDLTTSFVPRLRFRGSHVKHDWAISAFSVGSVICGGFFKNDGCDLLSPFSSGSGDLTTPSGKIVDNGLLAGSSNSGCRLVGYPALCCSACVNESLLSSGGNKMSDGLLLRGAKTSADLETHAGKNWNKSKHARRRRRSQHDKNTAPVSTASASDSKVVFSAPATPLATSNGFSCLQAMDDIACLVGTQEDAAASMTGDVETSSLSVSSWLRGARYRRWRRSVITDQCMQPEISFLGVATLSSEPSEQQGFSPVTTPIPVDELSSLDVYCLGCEMGSPSMPAIALQLKADHVLAEEGSLTVCSSEASDAAGCYVSALECYIIVEYVIQQMCKQADVL